jgi:hypothetical protein
MDNKNLTVFSKILSFLNELNKSFGNKHENIFNYYKLCKNTKISKMNSIKNHVKFFTTFLTSNKDHIINTNFEDFNPTEIRISDKVFIDFKVILQTADKETRTAIFKHLQYLLLLVDPSATEAKNALIQKDDHSYIDDLMGIVNNNFEPNQDPTMLAKNLMTNPKFKGLANKVKNDLNNGSFDFNKLIGGLMSKLGEMAEKAQETNPEMKEVAPILEQLTGSINSTLNGGQPDIAGLMGTMSNLMGMANKKTTNDSENNDEFKNDMSGVMGNMKPLMDSLLGGQEGGENPMAGMMDMLGPMMSGLMGGQGGNGENPMAGMMDMLGPMMSGLMGGQGGNLEDMMKGLMKPQIKEE